MKAQARDIGDALRALDPRFIAVLVYGPNEGLVRERADAFASQVVKDLKDPFNVAILSSADVIDDPARLADEAAAMSLMGGRRVVRVEGAGDAVAGPLGHVLSDPKGDSLIVISAGDLPPRSALRKLVEDAPNALAVPCYEDDARSLEALIRQILQQNGGLMIDADALRYLLDNLGADRMVARGEVEKLALYKARDTDRNVRLADVEAIIGNSATLAVDVVADAVMGGDLERLDRALTQAYVQGQSAITVLRAVGRRAMRLYEAAGHVAEGMRPEDAVKKLRPPVFFKDLPSFTAQARRWTPERLAAAIRIVTEAERDAKSGQFPAETICARACLRIANAARAGGR